MIPEFLLRRLFECLLTTKGLELKCGTQHSSSWWDLNVVISPQPFDNSQPGAISSYNMAPSPFFILFGLLLISIRWSGVAPSLKRQIPGKLMLSLISSLKKCPRWLVVQYGVCRTDYFGTGQCGKVRIGEIETNNANNRQNIQSTAQCNVSRENVAPSEHLLYSSLICWYSIDPNQFHTKVTSSSSSSLNPT